MKVQIMNVQIPKRPKLIKKIVCMWEHAGSDYLNKVVELI